MDEETGLHYFGARYYDSRASIWLSVDPLAEKFPSIGPYAYCYQNPINVIDLDGLEGIVVSGQPGGHSNKAHFLANGLDRAQKALSKRQSKTEKVTWIVYNDGTSRNGHSKEMIKDYKKKAEKLGIVFKEVKSSREIIDYMNDKTGGDSRSKDKITSFYYLGHATPGELNPGYPNKDGVLDPDNLNEGSFSSGTWINVVGGCRTDVDNSIIWDDSVVDKLQSKVDNKSTINGSNVRVQYDGGVRTDEQLLQENGGEIITVKGKKK